MSDSDDIKKILETVYGVAKWKRISKTGIVCQPLGEKYTKREFKDPASGIVLQVFTDDEYGHHMPYNGQKVIFGIAQDGDQTGNAVIRFSDPFIELNDPYGQVVNRETWGDLLIMNLIGLLLPSWVEHDGESQFSVESTVKPWGQVISELQAAGFHLDLDLSNKMAADLDSTPYSSLADIVAHGTPGYKPSSLVHGWTGVEPVLFAIYEDASSGEASVAFAEETFWKKNGYLFDQQLDYQLEHQGFVLPSYLDESSENSFIVDMDTNGNAPPSTQVKADLIAAGFVFSPEMDKFLNRTDDDFEDAVTYHSGPIDISNWDSTKVAPSQVNGWFGNLPVSFGIATLDDGITVMFAEIGGDDGMDQQIDYQLKAQGYKVPAYLDEHMENTFVATEPGMYQTNTATIYPTMTVAKIKADLIKAGFFHDPEFDKAIQY